MTTIFQENESFERTVQKLINDILVTILETHKMVLPSIQLLFVAIKDEFNQLFLIANAAQWWTLFTAYFNAEMDAMKHSITRLVIASNTDASLVTPPSTLQVFAMPSTRFLEK